MARAPFQVLVLPYRYIDGGELEYAVFFRETVSYGDFWQFIAGGGEDRETPLEAAQRESFEEGAIPPDNPYLKLDSMATVPTPFAAGMLWGDKVLVIPEYAFGVHAQDYEIILSQEHIEYRWVDYDTARDLLKWDSNRNALWELDYRLILLGDQKK